MSKSMYSHAELMAIESACKDNKNLYGELKGASYLTMDLSKRIKNNVIFVFMKVSSYGKGTESSGKLNIKVDYVGFEVENIFVVGYGLDYAENYRKLPYIGYVED